MRVVIDANVFVSAAIRTGPSHRIVQAWLQRNAFDVVISRLLVAEVRDVLTGRPRLRRWIDLATAQNFLDTIEALLLTLSMIPSRSQRRRETSMTTTSSRSAAVTTSTTS